MNRFKLGESLDSIVRKHLLTLSRHPLNDDDIEIAIHKGWQARDEEIKELESKLAKAREALEFYAHGEMIIVQQTDPLFSEIEKEMETLSDFFDAYVNDGYWIKGKRAWQVLKEIE